MSAKKRKAKLHAEVDAEYAPLARYMSKFHWLAAKDIFQLWREEKMHIDRFGKRFPELINITADFVDGAGAKEPG